MKCLLPVLTSVLALSGCTTPHSARPAIAAEELARLLRQSPSKAKIVLVNFTVTGSHRQKMNGPIASYPMAASKAFAGSKKVQSFIDNPGDGFRPIKGADGRLLTENRSQSPTFTTRETPFVVSALPGQAYRLPLHLRQPGAVLEIKCEGIDRSGRTVDPARP